jgi:hypothetical protein
MTDWTSPDWREEPFDRDSARADRWDRLDDELVREQDLVDGLRDRAGLPEGARPRNERKAA